MKDFYPHTDLENLSQTLDKYGVAVLPNVFTADECDELRAYIFDYIEKHHSVKTPDDVGRQLNPSYGIVNTYGIALLPRLIELKTDERTIEPFRRIWSEHELTTSLDSINIGAPPELTTDKRFFDPVTSCWFHTDQASHKTEKCCVQGFINLEATETGDGCLAVLTGSHNHHAEFFRHFGVSSGGADWYVLGANHREWFVATKGCEWNTILAPKGSMVFWDSRTIHMGMAPRENRPNAGRWRMLAYVCYTPARWQTEKDARLKRRAYVENRCTAHWPYDVKVGGKRADDEKENNRVENLTEKQKRYLGINVNDENGERGILQRLLDIF